MAWDDIKASLKEKLSGSGYQTFLSSASLLSCDENILTLEVPNDFSKQWLKEKCESFMTDYWVDVHNESLVVNYVVSEEEAQKQDNEQLTIFDRPKMDPMSEYSHFNPKYTFENYIVGHNNRFAYAASEAVSKAPAKAYNPLFIYGSVGLGKTHLLHAIGIRMQERNPDTKIIFVSSEKFTNDLINAIKDKKTESFRAKYRHADVLVVDDIQFLAGKEQTQVEFFHTFNDLYSNEKQIILTSDRPPKDIPTLELRLKTRFEWGLIADMQPPEFETRIAILRKKIEMNHFDISEDILHYIATQIPTNVREMEGALNRIVAYASLLNTKITLSIASNVIQDIVGIKQEKPLSISYIQRKVCDFFNISSKEMISKARTKELVYARQIAMYLARELTNTSLPKIGECFGNRDHSTVMHACDKVKSLMAEDIETKNVINVLISDIKSED